MLFLEGGEELDEGFAGFVFEDDGFREDSVTEAVARGGEFALRGFGAAGFDSVGTGGGDLEFGRHEFLFRLYCAPGWGFGWRGWVGRVFGFSGLWGKIKLFGP